jgi:hypothetical protein
MTRTSPFLLTRVRCIVSPSNTVQCNLPSNGHVENTVRYISFVVSIQHSLLQTVFILETNVREKSCENSYGKFRIRFPGVSFPLKLSMLRSCRSDFQRLPKNSLLYVVKLALGLGSFFNGIPCTLSSAGAVIAQ